MARSLAAFCSLAVERDVGACTFVGAANAALAALPSEAEWKKFQLSMPPHLPWLPGPKHTPMEGLGLAEAAPGNGDS